MRIEFIKDIPVNKTIYKKGEQENFSNSVGQNFIDNNEAKKVLPSKINTKKNKDEQK